MIIHLSVPCQYNVSTMSVQCQYNVSTMSVPCQYNVSTMSVQCQFLCNFLLLQIDFGSYRRVTRLATQGASDVPFYVTYFRLEYSNNSVTWHKYKENGHEMVTEPSGVGCRGNEPSGIWVKGYLYLCQEWSGWVFEPQELGKGVFKPPGDLRERVLNTARFGRRVVWTLRRFSSEGASGLRGILASRGREWKYDSSRLPFILPSCICTIWVWIFQVLIIIYYDNFRNWRDLKTAVKPSIPSWPNLLSQSLLVTSELFLQQHHNSRSCAQRFMGVWLNQCRAMGVRLWHTHTHTHTHTQGLWTNIFIAARPWRYLSRPSLLGCCCCCYYYYYCYYYCYYGIYYNY